MTNIDLSQLKRHLPYKWRVQSYSEYKEECSCVAYIDSRDVQNLLDDVLGPENWQDEYYQVKNTMLCKIGVKIGDEWVWKSDGGTETDIESEKGELSDSFKRAAVKLGIGRFLYDLDILKLKTNEKLVKENGRAKNRPYPVDEYGKRIWDITKYVNEISKSNLPDIMAQMDITNDIEELKTLFTTGMSVAKDQDKYKLEKHKDKNKTRISKLNVHTA